MLLNMYASVIIQVNLTRLPQNVIKSELFEFIIELIKHPVMNVTQWEGKLLINI